MVGSNYDSAYVVLDIRHPAGLTSDEILKTIRERIEPFNVRYEAGLRVERESGLDPVLTDPDAPFVRSLIEAYEAVYGREGKALTSAGTTYAKKLPRAVSFGPAHSGEPARAHAANEHVSLDELDRLTRVYATAVLKLAAR
jgi:acetylornithine deacetylase/succinyl-diaminopimelate desuccinylase-like protein